MFSTIGVGGDYASLFDASTDFNAVANTGNWTIQILNDLTEPSNIAFGNTVLSSNTILIVPATGVTATVTFSTTTDNAGPSGSFIVGSNSINAYNLFTVNNFIIDGSNNGSATRNLTFTSSTSFIGYMYLLGALGNCPGFTVKNCNLIARGGTASSAYAFRAVERKDASSNLLKPDNFKVLNCYLVCTDTWSGQGIGFSLPTLTASVDSVITGYTIADNTIYARTRGIFVNGGLSGNITGNTIRIRQTDSGYSSSAIWHYSANGRTDFTMNIIGNKIDSMFSANTSTGSFGLVGMDIGISGGKYNVINNMICGYTYGAASAPVNMLYRGIVTGAGATTTYYNILNNSIDLTNNPVLSAQSANLNFGIGFTASASVSVVTAKNNIIRVGQSGGACIFSLSTAFTSFVSDYNDLYATNGAIIGNITPISGYYSTLSAWKGAFNTDVNSQSVDPFATSPSSWVSISDLHFNPFVATASAAPLTAGTPITEITTDIDGQTRNVSTPLEGLR